MEKKDKTWLSILYLSILIVGIYCFNQVETIRDTYQNENIGVIEDGREDKSQKYALERLLIQSNGLQSWALVLISGLIAISITTKVHKIKHINRMFILNGTAITLLAASLYAGLVLQRRGNYFTWLNNYNDLETINSFLYLQQQYLVYAVALLSLMALYFISNIVVGRTKPYEH